MAHRFSVAIILSALSLFSYSTAHAPQAPIAKPPGHARSGPTAEAALYAPDPQPDLAAAHRISLASVYQSALSDEQLANLERNGPWLTDDGLSANAQSLIRYIQDARIHGLNPETYELSTILDTVDALSELDRWPSQMAFAIVKPVRLEQLTNQLTPTVLDSITVVADAERSTASDLQHSKPGYTQSLAVLTLAENVQPSNDNTRSDGLRNELTELLDRSFQQLATHLGQGVVNGRTVQPKLYRNPPRINGGALLQLVDQGKLSVSQALESSVPTHEYYERLTGFMRDLLTEQASSVKRTRVNIQSSDQTDDSDQIAQRLFETHLLSAEELFAPEQSKLVAALQQFQRRNGLPISGKADRRTRQSLNRTVEQDMAAIALSLERWRWMPRELGELHVFVNIPDYRVIVKDGNSTRLSMTAVVGAKEHQTPSFSRDMSYMEFNPTWTVPAKIADKELIPIERRRPGYLQSRNFNFLQRRDGHLYPVAPETVTTEDFNKTPFPYVLQQRGGPGNALGNMKFMMPNPYAIYLHDTQSKGLFTLNDRAFSHGCIRLSEPESLARLLMQIDGYNERTINAKLSSEKTHRVRLRKPIPTHLTYLTAWVDENNELQLRSDIYDHDNALLQALKSSDSLPGELASLF